MATATAIKSSQKAKDDGLYTVEKKKNAQDLQELYRLYNRKVRNYFHRFYSKDPKKLYQELKKHKRAIKALRSKKEITAAQYFLIFPNDGSEETHSSEFDPPLFRQIFANFAPTNKPKEFWFKEPPINDHSDEANIVRLILARNFIQHGTGYVEDNKYNLIAKRIIDAMVDLGEDKKTFENVLPPTQYGLSKPVSNFFSRQNNLEEIDKLIQNGKNDILRVVVHGMTGMGKSELIRKYCEQFSETFDNNILWINSTNRATLESSFRNIAEMVGLQIKDENGESKGIEYIVNAVHQYFRTEQILYVFDDVTDMQSLKDFLPKHKPSATIITSQIRNWPQTDFQLHEVNQFDEIEGKTFLMNNVKEKQLREIQLNQIIEQIGGHPLALQQFVVAIEKTMLNIDNYLQLFIKELAKILSLTSISTMHGDKSVMTAIKITTDKIGENEDLKIASEILNTISYFYGEEISFDLIKLTFPEHDVIDLDNAVCQLESMSLMTKRSVNNKNVITVHSLIQKCLIFQHENRSKYLLRCLTMFNDQMNVKVDVCLHEKFGEKWYKHFIHFLSMVDKTILTEFMLTNDKVIFETLKSKGRLNDLIEIYKSLLAVFIENNGPTHDKTFQIMFVLACCYLDNGNLFEATALNKTILAQRIKSTGPSHPDTLITMNNLASCYQQTGKLDKAIDLYKSIVAEQTKIFGKSDPQTLKTMSNLASCFYRKKEMDKAIDLFEIVINESKSCADIYLDILIVMSNLASCLQYTGRLDEAITMNEKVLAEGTKKYGETHPFNLTGMNNLASCLHDLGKYTEAIELLEKVLIERTKKLGKMHPETIETINNLAICFQNKGENNKAIGLMENALQTLSQSNFPITTSNSPIKQTIERNLKLFKELRFSEEANKFFPPFLLFQVAWLVMNHIL